MQKQMQKTIDVDVTYSHEGVCQPQRHSTDERVNIGERQQDENGNVQQRRHQQNPATLTDYILEHKTTRSEIKRHEQQYLLHMSVSLGNLW